MRLAYVWLCSLLYATIAAAQEPMDCSVPMTGKDFLSALKQSGSLPMPAGKLCEFNSGSFQFDAGPQEPCIVRFERKDLLKESWKFVRVEAKGDFQVKTSNGDLVVTIAPKGGFRPERVVVVAALSKKDCDNVSKTAEEVLK